MPAATIDQTQLARLFDITPRHVRRLTADGILTKARDIDGTELRGRYELVVNVRAYCKYLREQAKLDDSSESRYVQLRNEKMAAENEMVQLKLKALKSELHRSEDIEFIWSNMLTSFKARMLAIASRITRLLVGQTKFQVIYDLIHTEVELALRELSQYDRSMFSKQNAAFLAAQGADATALNGEKDASDSATDEEGD